GGTMSQRAPTRVSTPSLGRIFEFRQRSERVLCAARQHHLVVDELQAVVRDNDQVAPHAQETADRQHGKGCLAVRTHEKIVDLPDAFVGIVYDIAPSDLGRTIARGQGLDVYLGNRDRLRRALRQRGAGDQSYTYHCRARQRYCFDHRWPPCWLISYTLLFTTRFHALKGSSFVSGARAAPLMPRGLPALSRSSRKGFTISIGIGKTTVEFCSAPISVSVCRERNCIAAGMLPRICAA